MKDIGITTTSIDVSVGVNAFQAYQKGDFKKAAEYLLDIIDREPQNWMARLYLGVCYSKTDQMFAAQRAFRYVYDNCQDKELKHKALTALHAVTAEIQGTSKKAPEEFGRFSNEHTATPPSHSRWKFGTS